MERLSAIEELIETGREEAPRIVAERSREAVEAVEAGIAAALATARQRLRPEPRRPSLGRQLLLAIVLAVVATIVAFVVAALVERAREWRRERQAGVPMEQARVAIPVVVDAEAATDADRADVEGGAGVEGGSERVETA